MQDNLKAVIRVMQYILRQHHVRRAQHQERLLPGVCGYDGEIKIVEDDGKLVWSAPTAVTAIRKR